MLRFGRLTAAVIGLSTFAFMFLHDSWRWDNVFLVPDLVLTAGLLVAAALPARSAPAALVLAFGYSAGVLACAAADRVVGGEAGVPALFGFAVCAAMTVLLSRGLRPLGVPVQQVHDGVGR